MTLHNDSMAGWTDRLNRTSARVAQDFPGEGPNRQPVHTVYGGAHLFSPGTAARLGQLATSTMEDWCPDPEAFASVLALDDTLAAPVYELVAEKLRTEPVEDFRLDFEDGYGHRPDEEEDGHARSAEEGNPNAERRYSLYQVGPG